jgi:lysophospholipase L1-like esterase
MVIRVIKPVLAPVLIAQAKRLRLVTVELPEPSGERQGVAHCPDVHGDASLSLLVAGDSSAAGVGAATQEEALAPQLAAGLAQRRRCRVQWQLIAQTGLTSRELLELLKAQTLPAVDVAVVIVGMNDITRDVALGHAIRARNRIVRLLAARTGVRYVVFAGLPAVERLPLLPQPLAWYGGTEARRNNAMQARWASHARRADCVSHVAMDGFTHPKLMAKDGFHPSPALYAMVAAHLADHLSRKLGALADAR